MASGNELAKAHFEDKFQTYFPVEPSFPYAIIEGREQRKVARLTLPYSHAKRPPRPTTLIVSSPDKPVTIDRFQFNDDWLPRTTHAVGGVVIGVNNTPRLLLFSLEEALFSWTNHYLGDTVTPFLRKMDPADQNVVVSPLASDGPYVLQNVWERRPGLLISGAETALEIHEANGMLVVTRVP